MQTQAKAIVAEWLKELRQRRGGIGSPAFATEVPRQFPSITATTCTGLSPCVSVLPIKFANSWPIRA